MNREIKFRAKRIDNGEWVYGNLYKCDKFARIITAFAYTNEDGENESLGQYYCEAYDVNINTICQFTGLYDKNGKEIYEGDIVKGTITSAWSKQKIKCQVKYEKDRFICIDNDNNIHKVMFGKDIAVIGNVYDNPEL